MWWTGTQAAAPAEVSALKVSILEDNVAHAGTALGCSYSSSAEYEAELIAARRAAGAYRPKHNPRSGRIAAVAAGLIVVVIVIIALA